MVNGRAKALLLSGILLGLLVAVGGVLWDGNNPLAEHAAASNAALRLDDIPFDGKRSYRYLQQICELGPRPSGSRGMQQQQALLTRHFEELGGKVTLQRFRTRHPQTGQAVHMANLHVVWHPQRRDRVLLCAHYDTRPFPSEDRDNPRGVFVGANDGGSGVALLMEMAHQMSAFDANFGVDFVLFDAEEFVFTERDAYFLGSEWFARKYVSDPPPYRYRVGVLLDMVGDADLQLYYERNSVWWRDTRPVVEAIWTTAARLGVREFIPKKGHEVKDDHLMLRNIAEIPTCDIIDFDYPYWHTQADTPDKCSALSLAKVGWVLSEWLKSARFAPSP